MSLNWIKSPKNRVIGAWVLLAITLVAWPLSILFTDEPPFILSLSWLALTLTCADIIATTDIRAQK